MKENADLEARMIMAEMDLEDSKRFNKMAAGMAIILLIMLCAVMHDLHRLSDRYEELEMRYEVLQEEMNGGEER